MSFIYYITDPEEACLSKAGHASGLQEWTAAEGGALELYPSEPSTGRGSKVERGSSNGKFQKGF